MKNLLPISDIKKIETLETRYMPGNPRSYRLDLGKGVLNLEGNHLFIQRQISQQTTFQTGKGRQNQEDCRPYLHAEFY